MTTGRAAPLVRIVLVWPGPIRNLADGVPFFVQYESEGVTGVVLLSPRDLSEQRILDAYRRGHPIPRPGEPAGRARAGGRP